MYISQLDYDLATPDEGYPDPCDSPRMLADYLDEHKITMQEFVDNVSDGEFWQWVKETYNDF